MAAGPGFQLQLQPKEEPAKAKGAKVSVKSLREKAGTYLSKPVGMVLRLEEKDGKLQRVDRDGSAQALLALADNRFRFEPYPIELEFDGTGEQRVVKVRFGDQKPTTLQRVPAVTPSAAELNDYVGLFASEELDARYRTQVTDGKLQVATLKSDSLELAPVTKDVFAGEFGTVTFARDGNGRVNGFSLSTGRAWNNEFAKLE